VGPTRRSQVKDAPIEVQLYNITSLKFSFFAVAMFSSGSSGPIISRAEGLRLCELRRDRFYRS
jgi:hypothetical protein